MGVGVDGVGGILLLGGGFNQVTQDKNAATDRKVRQNNTQFSLPRSRRMLVTALGSFFLKR